MCTPQQNELFYPALRRIGVNLSHCSDVRRTTALLPLKAEVHPRSCMPQTCQNLDSNQTGAKAVLPTCGPRPSVSLTAHWPYSFARRHPRAVASKQGVAMNCDLLRPTPPT